LLHYYDMEIYPLQNMFAVVDTKPALQEPAEPSYAKNEKPDFTPADSHYETANNETTKADNESPVSEQNETGNDQSQDFDNTFDEKTKTSTDNEAQAEQKTENKNDEAVSALPSEQPFTLDELLAASSANVKTSTVASLVGQIAKPIITEPVITKPVITKSDTGKPVIAESVITKPEITKSEQTTLENTEKQQASDNAPVVNNKLTDPDEIAANSSEEMVLKDSPVIIPGQDPNPQSGKELVPEIVTSNNQITADSERLDVANKPIVPDSPQTQLPNTQFAAAGDQSSNSQEKILVGQESPVPAAAAEETTPHKAHTGEKDLRGQTELFELPEKSRFQIGDLQARSIAQKMSPQQRQLSATQIENHNNLLSNHGSNPDMEQGEQVFVGGNVQSGITEQSSAPPPASTAFSNIAGSSYSGNRVSEQIQESINSSIRQGSQQIIIRLNPPELGKVAIKFTEQGNDIMGLLQVDKPQTRDQIQQALPEIIQNLQNSGITIKKLEVVLTNQQEEYTPKEQSSTAGQGDFSGQQNSTNPDLQRNNAAYNQWQENVVSVKEFTGSQMHFTDNSINMLA